MKTVLFEILQAVLIAVVPVLAACAVQLINRAAERLEEQTGNERMQKILTEAKEAVTAAVIATSQTYVDGLKKSGTFTAENQVEAFNMARRSAMAMMAQETQDVIGLVYGDLDEWLTLQIEATVRNEKGYDSLIP